MKLNEKTYMKAKCERTIKRTKDHISPASKSSSAILPMYKTWNFWPEPLKTFRTACSLELISMAYQSWYSVFSLTTNQPTVFSVMAYQPSEQGDTPLVFFLVIGSTY
jgi:hypothetical protein